MHFEGTFEKVNPYFAHINSDNTILLLLLLLLLSNCIDSSLLLCTLYNIERARHKNPTHVTGIAWSEVVDKLPDG